MSQTQYLQNCIKAHTQIQMFLENSEQDIDSRYNPGISLNYIFGHAKRL